MQHRLLSVVDFPSMWVKSSHGQSLEAMKWAERHHLKAAKP